MTKKPPIDVHQQVTDAIVAAIEANPGEYRMPWQRSGFASAMPRNAVTKNYYAGINTLICFCQAEKMQYPTALWATFKQWQQIGGRVRAGEKGTLIVFYKQYDVEPAGDDDDGKRLACKHSFVFNASQVDGHEVEALPPMAPLQRHDAMQRLAAATGIEIRKGGEAAYYVPSLDFVQMPDERCFRQTDAGERMFHYESTLAHELVHATGHSKRLGRDLTGRFSSDSYCIEELIALSGQSGCELSGQSGATRSEL